MSPNRLNPARCDSFWPLEQEGDGPLNAVITLDPRAAEVAFETAVPLEPGAFTVSVTGQPSGRSAASGFPSQASMPGGIGALTLPTKPRS